MCLDPDAYEKYMNWKKIRGQLFDTCHFSSFSDLFEANKMSNIFVSHWMWDKKKKQCECVSHSGEVAMNIFHKFWLINGEKKQPKNKESNRL